MKKTLLSLSALSLLASVQSFAFELPAAQILQAAKTIQTQTGPAYSVTGTLACTAISKDFPPYGTDSRCEISIGNQTTEFTPDAALLKALKKEVPAYGPVYQVKGEFTATSISQEFPPYGSTKHVEFTLAQ